MSARHHGLVVRLNPSHGTSARPSYLRLELGGGSELKEQLHDVIVSLLGGEEQRGGARLEAAERDLY